MSFQDLFELSAIELNAFAHGVRIQRQANGMTHKDLWNATRMAQLAIPFSTLSQAETVPGGYRVYMRFPKARKAVSEKLGVAESMLIRIGQKYIDDHGCYPCRFQRSPDCRAH